MIDPALAPAPDVSDLLPQTEVRRAVDPDGVVVDSDVVDSISDDLLRRFWRDMLFTRRLDAECIALQRQGQLGVYASCRGQEAAQVGSALALNETDWVFPSYREMGAAVVRGLGAEAIAHVFRGTWLGAHDVPATRFGLLSIPIGTQALHAVGFAHAQKMRNTGVVTMAYFGDGATSEGDTHEALNFAGVWHSPVVFIVQNNQYAISVPLSSQTAAPTLAHKAVGYGVRGRRVDGNDVVAVFAAARDAAAAARDGDGPTMIEALTYRMEAHTTSDDPTRYRTKDEEAAAARLDPITRAEQLLKARNLWDDAWADDSRAAADAAAQALRDVIYEAPHPDPAELFDHVYVEPGRHFDVDRDRLAQEQADRGAGDGHGGAS